MNDPTRHLDADQLRAALVAESLLPPEAVRHLSRCQMCRQSVSDAKARLDRLAARARAAVPVPRRRLVLNEAALGGRRGLRWRWLSMATAAMLLLAVGTLTIYPELLPGGSGRGSRGERLAAALDRLKQTVLRSTDPQLAGEAPLEVDEEFLDFLIPDSEAAPLSLAAERLEAVS